MGGMPNEHVMRSNLCLKHSCCGGNLHNPTASTRAVPALLSTGSCLPAHSTTPAAPTCQGGLLWTQQSAHSLVVAAGNGQQQWGGAWGWIWVGGRGLGSQKPDVHLQRMHQLAAASVAM